MQNNYVHGSFIPVKLLNCMCGYTLVFGQVLPHNFDGRFQPETVKWGVSANNAGAIRLQWHVAPCTARAYYEGQERTALYATTASTRHHRPVPA